MKKGEINFSAVLANLIFIVLLAILIYALYVLYLNIPGEPEKLDVPLQQLEQKTISEAKQFYPNMKFNHNTITYVIDPNCDETKINRIKRAFDELTKIDKLAFKETKDKADIVATCTKSDEEIKEDYIIAGEGGAKEIIDTGRYHVILEGIIYLYNNDKKSLDCDYPNIEVHELLHVFGFDHVNDENSIMYPLLESCSQQLDNSIVNELNRLYTVENLPDMYFDNLEVIKRGRYLDFNVSVKNSGSVNTNNISLFVLEDDSVNDVYYLDNLTMGGGIVINTQNFRLENRDPKKISFVIDKENKIKEIDEKNNVVEINL